MKAAVTGLKRGGWWWRFENEEWSGWSEKKQFYSLDIIVKRFCLMKAGGRTTKFLEVELESGATIPAVLF